MKKRHPGRGSPPQGMGLVVMLAVLLMASVEAGDARGFGGHHGCGGHQSFRGPHGCGGSPVWLGLGPSWGPSWPYDDPPVVGASLGAVSGDPSLSDPVPPQYSWYYCENPQGYYPSVPQCPDGWRPVTPTPPQLSVPQQRDRPSGTVLSPSGPPPHERKAPLAVVQVQRHYDTDDRACLFSAPDTHAKKLGKVYSGVPLKVVEERAAWLYIESPLGRRGWILRDWIQE